jgi:hypothetical protein
MDEAFEAEGEARCAVAAEGGLQGLQMFQHRPEKLLGHLRVRVRLAWDSVFFGGAVAPRNADSGAE